MALKRRQWLFVCAGLVSAVGCSGQGSGASTAPPPAVTAPPAAMTAAGKVDRLDPGLDALVAPSAVYRIRTLVGR